MQHFGKILIFIGVCIALIGIVLYLAGNKLSWLGRLPGDIRIERDQFRFYFPFTTMLLVSALLTLILSLVKKFFR